MAPYENDCALFSVSQKAIIKDKKGRVLMMEKTGKSHWDLPGGKLDSGEDMLKSIAREVFEEIGFDKVDFGDIIYSGRRSFEEKGKPERIMIFYECEIDQKFEKIKLSEEHSQWRLLSKEEVDDQKKYEINPVVRQALKIAFSRK